MCPPQYEIENALLRHILEHGGSNCEVRAQSTYEPLADHWAHPRSEVVLVLWTVGGPK